MIELDAILAVMLRCLDMLQDWIPKVGNYGV